MKYSKIGRPRQATDEHIKEFLEWHRKKQELGTLAALAKRLGYTPALAYTAIHRKGVYKLPPPKKKTA